jgi:hypothetical protein
MNNKDVKKRELLEFKEFLKVIADPWSAKNLRKVETGFHKIKLERPFEYIGYGDAIFKRISKIDYPGEGAVQSGIASDTGISS